MWQPPAGGDFCLHHREGCGVIWLSYMNPEKSAQILFSLNLCLSVRAEEHQAGLPQLHWERLSAARLGLSWAFAVLVRKEGVCLSSPLFWEDDYTSLFLTGSSPLLPVPQPSASSLTSQPFSRVCVRFSGSGSGRRGAEVPAT